ncbi:MAG: proprotein convertase P-domain-containing protein [Luteolibacter sp.]|uniref:proprotein convertase P-domain-containing protein n=1 Tax=Luteolibacter sp. TaxID=1962973 RepID=UPI0032638826
MKNSTLPVIGMLLITANLGEAGDSKTKTPVKINPRLVNEEPYRFNGVVLTDEFRGSGFCAWSDRTFFSAAHVVYHEGSWDAPPVWYSQANAASLDQVPSIPSRGYYRWSNYAELADDETTGQTEFGRDVILAYAFEKVITGKPATINFAGTKDLRGEVKTLITGYPADNLYIDESIDGYFMHKTGPVVSPYKTFAGNALTTTLVSTGHGNSGGPIWTKDKNLGWTAAGVLVGGLPSESIVYAFSKDTNSLLRAVTPVIQPELESPVAIKGVESSSTFFPYERTVKIPDGRQSWTSFRIPVNTFPNKAAVKSVALSLTILTKHRGDLQIVLEGPGGYQALVQNEQGADKNNFILKSADFSESFVGIEANGAWFLRVQDRLVGDIATFKSALLEISTADVVVPPTP